MSRTATRLFHVAAADLPAFAEAALGAAHSPELSGLVCDELAVTGPRWGALLLVTARYSEPPRRDAWAS